MRSTLFLLLIAVLVTLGCVVSASNSINGLPIHMERLGDNAIRLWVGDYLSSTAVSAVKTEKGIVVIDTTELPELDSRFREMIAKEFGSDDFAYLINTHEHADHTSGNQVYSDCEIIAHEYCAEGMKQRRADSARVVQWLEERIPALEDELAQAEPGTEEHKKINEEITIRKMILANHQSGNEPVFPTRTLSESMTLDMGDTTIELYNVGGTHTASDIFIFVPRDGLLFTGDMMADTWLTDTPGCLQAFRLQQGVKRDIPLMLKNWKSLIERQDEITDFVPGHWNGDLTRQGFVDRYNYVKSMYDGIANSLEGGSTIEDLFTEFSMDARFPELKGTPGFTEDFVHHGSIIALMSDITGTVSASDSLAAMLEEKSPEKAVSAIRKEHDTGSKKYYFLEHEFNALGYRYLNEEKYDQAIAVFKLNVELYPASWNTHDSLGEALMKNGQIKLATACYNKSLELNPDNENGKRMLAEIDTVMAKK